PTFGSDHLGGDERVRARAAAEVEHPRAGLEASEREGVCDAGERLDRRLGHSGKFLWIAEVDRPGTPRREDPVLMRILRDRGVGLADLGLQNGDIELLVNGHRAETTRAPAIALDEIADRGYRLNRWEAVCS